MRLVCFPLVLVDEQVSSVVRELKQLPRSSVLEDQQVWLDNSVLEN